MRVRAIRGFAARLPDGRRFHLAEGETADVSDLPRAVVEDWMRAGLIVPERPKHENEVREGRERRGTPTAEEE